MNRSERLDRSLTQTKAVACSGYLLLLVVAAGLLSCSTAPRERNQASFAASAEAATAYFETNVYGLDKQIENSAGYVVFPGVGQWGVIYAGGQFGRGMVCDSNGKQIGWAAIHTPSLGLQAGVRVQLIIEIIIQLFN